MFALAPGVPVTLDAVSFAVSAALIASLPRTTRLLRPHRNIRREIAEGMTWLWKSATLRAMTVLTTALGAVSGALLAMLVVYAHEQLHVASVGYGLLLGSFAIGSISGALWAPRLMRGHSLRTILGGSVVLTVFVFAGIAATSVTVVAAILLACLGLAVSTWNIASVTTRQRIVPNELLGRVSSAYRASALTFTTLGALGAGLLTSATSVSITMWACAGLTLLGLGLGSRGLRTIQAQS